MQLSRSFRRRAGFSLIELLITVMLLSLVLMAVIPELGTWMKNVQIRNTAESILGGMQRARAEAVSRNRPVRFSLVRLNDPARMDNTCTLATTGTSWVVSIDSPAGLCGVEPSPTTLPRIITSKAAGDGGLRTAVQSVGDGSGPASSIVFDNYGRVANNARTIQTINVTATGDNAADSRPLRIVVALGGGVRMCDPAVTATADPRRCGP